MIASSRAADKATRFSTDSTKGNAKFRLPREERMKGYKDVDLIQYDKPFERFPDDVIPVAIEVRDTSENLFEFVHPEKAVYVFGPEDGSISPVQLRHCHRFVIIPAKHCLNLAMAVNTVLYDRMIKNYLKTGDTFVNPGDWEGRGPASTTSFEDFSVED